jgi:DNA invertase Pin-like site-specific DNA recombinase
MRVAMYARVSTKKQDNENQLEQLREFARNQAGWEIVVEYVDVVSGSGKKDRNEFDAMMLGASQRKFDVLVFWALDRLSREGIVKTLGYLEQLTAWGIQYRSYTQPFLDTGNEMTNGIVLSVLAAVAKQERISISIRTKAGLQRARKAGRVLGRKPSDVDMGRVRQMRASGRSLRAIADEVGCSASLLVKRGVEGALGCGQLG